MRKPNWLPAVAAFAISAGVTATALFVGSTPASVAADHFDGPRVKLESNKSADIADLYVFREGDQSENDADNDKLVFIMTIANVRYDIKVSRSRQNPTADKTLSFRVVGDNVFLNETFVGKTNTNNTTIVEGQSMMTFAGQTDDPFFADLRVIQEGPATGKDDPADSIAGGNVSALVASVPIAYFQTDANESAFFTWGSTSK